MSVSRQASQRKMMNGLAVSIRDLFIARSTTLFWAIALGVGAFRLYYCAQLPVNTGDIVRHLVYGFLVNQDGLGMAGKTLLEVNPLYASVSWSNLPYNYPSIPLFFFAAIRAEWSSSPRTAVES